MHEIKRVLRAAAWRLVFTSFLRNLTYVIALALAGLIALRLVQQLWPLEVEVAWLTIAQWAAGAAVLIALVWTIISRDSERAVARRVDEGADLRESLSTALCMVNVDDPWARVTVESASERARGVNLRQAVPIHAPRFWPVPLALSLTFLVVYMAVGTRQTGDTIARAEEKARVVEVQAVANEVKKIEDLVSSLEQKEGEKAADDAAAAEAPELKTPEQMSLQTLKKLTSALERLDQLKEGEQGLTNQTVNDMMKQLKTPGPGPLAEMSKELSKGNFAKAAEKLAEQMKKAQAGEMSEGEKKALAEQLKKMAEQMEALSQDRKQAEKELEKAGLNKELAKDPKKLAEALKNAKNLTEEQKKQLENQCKASEQACSACNKMGQSMSEMAQSMSQNGKMDPSALNAMQELAQQMGDLEKLASQMNSADAAMAECKAQMDALAKLCESQTQGMGECKNGGDGEGKIGQWKAGWSEQEGNGSGGPGRGNGSRRDQAKAPFQMKMEKVKTQTQAGPIIASEIIQADDHQRGESTQAVSDAVALAEQNAAEAMEGNQIPREFHDAVKHYFGRLKAKTEGTAGGASEKPAAKDGGTNASEGSGK